MQVYKLMAQVYTSKQGDMLDWICWHHYGQRRQLERAVREIDPVINHIAPALDDGIQALSQASPISLIGVIEKVLQANPGLAAKGPVLAAGIRIKLPDFTQSGEATTQLVSLWDD